MAALGRQGGLRGGAARAKALTATERTAIATKAARIRWSQPVLVIDADSPSDHGELLSFVANYGARVARLRAHPDLVDVALRAVEASRRDPSMARMLPVFLWRVRDQINLAKLVVEAKKRNSSAALGYFLELTSKLRPWNAIKGTLAKLRPHAHPRRPTFFFHKTATNPFEAMMAKERTPAEALRWGLLTGTPTDSFKSYFQKVADL
jgi:hypothetical protein